MVTKGDSIPKFNAQTISRKIQYNEISFSL